MFGMKMLKKHFKKKKSLRMSKEIIAYESGAKILTQSKKITEPLFRKLKAQNVK